MSRRRRAGACRSSGAVATLPRGSEAFTVQQSLKNISI
jgi:hypothetical protein